MKRRTAPPVSQVIETPDEARLRIAALPDDEREKAVNSLAEAEQVQAERQAKYDKERI
jgi:hypothetical protein